MRGFPREASHEAGLPLSPMEARAVYRSLKLKTDCKAPGCTRGEVGVAREWNHGQGQAPRFRVARHQVVKGGAWCTNSRIEVPRDAVRGL